MKIFASTLIFIFVLTTLSCSKSDTFTEFFGQHSPKQILEITSDFTGSWWMNGKVLDFRLYDNGNAEYDEYQTSSLPNGLLWAEAIKNTKRIKLSEVELQGISNLLTSNEFSKVEKNVTQQKICTDAFINTKITLSFKTENNEIVIKSHCSKLADSKSTSFYFQNFPPKINELFQKLNEIKNKESAGKFYN